MNSQDNAQARLFDWGTPAWMQPDPESTRTSDGAGLDVDHAIGHIVSRGFTERQARFLVLVARHSGVCVMRQYAAFGGVVFGHTTRRFFAKLERLGWVSTYDCARKRARIYHVRHRELYEPSVTPSRACVDRPLCRARSSGSCCWTSSWRSPISSGSPRQTRSWRTSPC